MIQVTQIQWRDAASIADFGEEWLTTERAIGESRKLFDEPCLSVGFLIEENEDFIVLANSRADGLWGGVQMIPKSVVITKDNL